MTTTNETDDLRPEDHELLERVLTGELEATDAAICAAAERSPAFAERLDSLLALSARLDRVGGLERTERAAAPVAGEDRAAEVARGWLRGEFDTPAPTGQPLPGPTPAPRSPVAPWLMAAVVLVGMTLWWRSCDEHVEPLVDPPTDDIYLDTTFPMTPALDAAAAAAAEWTWDFPVDGGHYVLRLEEVVEGEVGRTLVEVELDDARWAPSAAERATFTPRMRWSVEAFDLHGVSLKTSTLDVRPAR